MTTGLAVGDGGFEIEARFEVSFFFQTGAMVIFMVDGGR